MSAVERIKQALSQREAEAKKQQAVANESAAKERLRREAKDSVERTKIAAINRKAEERHLFVVKQTEKILNESGVLADLQQIDNEILTATAFTHGLIYNPNKYRGASLIWGENIEISEEGTCPSDKYRDARWSFIKVYVDPDNEDLFIEGVEKLNKLEWKNKDLVGSKLAEAYFHPRTSLCHYEEPEPSDDGVNGQDSNAPGQNR